MKTGTYRLFFVLLIALLAEQASAQLLKYTATISNARQSKGYFFLFTYRMQKTEPAAKGQQMIIDGTGHTVYYRLTPKASDFKAHRNGMLSFFNNDKFYLMDKTFRIVDSVSCVNGIETDSHDFVILPNGDYLLIGTESKEADLSGVKLFMQKNLPGSAHAKVKAGVVQQLSRDKKLLYQWNARDYFRLQDADPVYLNDTVNIDITHFNSVDMNRKGEFIISARYTNEVIKVSKKTNRLMWRLGGPHNDFKFVNDSTPFLGQHDARFLCNGHITLFDNGYGREEQKHNVRAIEYNLDEKRKEARLVWSYAHPTKVISEATGNAQRLKNGNTLLNYGRISNNSANVTFEEVNRKGQPVIQVSFTDTIGSYRAFHYKKLPFKLPQPKVIKTKEGDGLYLQVQAGASSFKWSTGETTQRIQITQPGNYFVYVPIGDGGYISSVPVSVK